MEKKDSLSKEIQDLNSDGMSDILHQNLNCFIQQPQAVSSKETRFATFQLAPATTWSNCVEKTQNMLRGGQEAAGWFHFHKVAAASGHEIFTPPIDMQQQVYYGLPEMRGDVRTCYPGDMRSGGSYPAQSSDMRSYQQHDLRPPPPPQVVNQRFIQCVNHFAPGSRTLPCLLQPSYFGYEYSNPMQQQQQGGGDTMLPRMNYGGEGGDRQQRYPQHHEWNPVRQELPSPMGYRQPPPPLPRDYMETSFPRGYDTATRKSKTQLESCEQKLNRDKFGCASPFSFLAVEVSQEMQGVIGAGGHALADLLDFCKFVQSFLLTPVALTSQRNQLIREIVLSFIHVSSAYVHLGSVLHSAEQPGLPQSELEGLRTCSSLWESTSTSVILALKSLIHSLSDIKAPELKKQPQQQDVESDQVPVFRPDTFYPASFYPNVESPFLNYSLNENGFRFPRAQYRPEFNFNQHFEYKRKYQSTANTQKETSTTFNNNTCSLGMQRNTFNFKAKSCAQNAGHSNGNASKGRSCEQQHCTATSDGDQDKTKLPENHEIKNFSFNLLNPDKRKNRGKVPCDRDSTDKAATIQGKHKVDVLEQVCISSSGQDEESLVSCLKEPGTTADIDRSIVSPSLHVTSRSSYSAMSKTNDWNLGVFNTPDKTELRKPFHLLPKETERVSAESQTQRGSNPVFAEAAGGQDPAEKPMTDAGLLRFLNPELNKALEEHCEAARIQLKHKMLDILGFIQTPQDPIASLNSNTDQVGEIKKMMQEGLTRISYLVYNDEYRGVGEMLSAVRNLFHKTRIQNLTNLKAVSLADELESSFLDLFKKEFGCCSLMLHSRDNH